MSEPNWFIAFPIDPGSWFDARVADPPTGIRRLHPADLHISLAFFGACGEARATAAWSALTPPLPRTEVSLGAVVPLGPPARWSALSAELTTGREAVEAAMAAWRDLLCDLAGAGRDHRPPRPHATLARPQRSATHAERDAGLRWARALDLRDVSLTLDRVSLYTWDAPQRATRFREVASLAL